VSRVNSDLGIGAFHDPVCVDHAKWILPRIEARHLAQERTIDVESELPADVEAGWSILAG
jgi:hypothetical protein